MKKSSLIVVACLLSGVLFPTGLNAQFLSRAYYPFWDEPYENYGTENYRDYRERAERRIYDPFGIYLIDGFDLFRLEQFKTLSPFRGDILVKSSDYDNLFQKLVIVNDEYAGWSSSVIVGDAIKTRLTPSTLNLARLNGIRWDASSRKSRFSVVGSRVSNPQLEGIQEEQIEAKAPYFMRFFSSYLFGGHWESTFGDILTLGGTYINMHHMDSLTGRKSGSLKGVTPSSVEGTTTLFVIFSDDSPEDGSGAEVFDVRIFVDGMERADIKPEIRKLPDVIRLRRRFLTVRDLSHIRRNGPWLLETMSYEYMFETKKQDGDGGLFAQDGIEVADTDGSLTADGTDVLVYKYQIPADAKRVSFKVLVADDYSIDVAAGLGWAFTWADWHNVARASGNPKERSNLRWVSFDYGFPTGMSLYGANLKVNLLGFALNGEYANTLNYRQFPVPEGSRSEQGSGVYFLNLLKSAARWDIGGELFRFPPEYSTSLPVWMDTRPGKPGAVPYELVDDNDDQDEWPDSWEHWDPLHPSYDPQYDPYHPAFDPEDLERIRAPWYADMNLRPRPTCLGLGVYPGLDENGDGRPDYDTKESIFLDYWIDPLGYVYGDDFNNNGVVDVRENDNKPDYPYELDTQGHHLFLHLRPREGLSCRLGRYDVKQIAGDGQSLVKYSELTYARGLPSVGDVRCSYRVKGVRDDIPDDIYHIGTSAIRHDPLDMRNSLEHVLYLDGHVTNGAGLSLVQRMKWTTNFQRETTFSDGTRQPEGRVTGLTWVSKSHYTRVLGRVAVTPMFKYLLGRQKRTAPASKETEYSLLPLLRVDVPLGRHFRLKFGLEGLPFLAHQYRNVSNPTENSDTHSRVVVLENRSKYLGYNVVIDLSYQRTDRELVGLTDPRDETYVKYALRIFAE